MRFFKSSLLLFIFMGVFFHSVHTFGDVKYYLNPNPVLIGRTMFLAVEHQPSFSQLWIIRTQFDDTITLERADDGIWYADIPIPKKNTLEGKFYFELKSLHKDGELSSRKLYYSVTNQLDQLLDSTKVTLVQTIVESIKVRSSTLNSLYLKLNKSETRYLKTEYKTIKGIVNPAHKFRQNEQFDLFLKRLLDNKKTQLNDVKQLIVVMKKQKRAFRTRNDELYKDGIRVQFDDESYKSFGEKKSSFKEITDTYYQNQNYMEMTLTHYRSFLNYLEREEQFLLSLIKTYTLKTEESGSALTVETITTLENSKIDPVIYDHTSQLNLISDYNRNLLKVTKEQLDLEKSLLNLKNFRSDF
jgi:hypothetical protein